MKFQPWLDTFEIENVRRVAGEADDEGVWVYWFALEVNMHVFGRGLRGEREGRDGGKYHLRMRCCR